MAHWNHRIVKKIYEDGTEEYSVRETHYNDNDKIYAYMTEPVTLSCETIGGLEKYIQRCLNCLDKPILEEDNITLFEINNKKENNQ